MKKIRWGILSTAKIGVEKVIPALQSSALGAVTAIASRDENAARAAAARLNIPKAYGSYEALLQDDAIDAVYIPLPNHLHVPWSIRALEAGKHVLCEKPIGLSAREAQQLLLAAQRHPQLKIMEAFMYRFHPQWQETKRLVDNGSIGQLHTIQSFFSYYNDDPANIRNQAALGGGGLMDIGCYCISFARFLFGEEPQQVTGLQEVDSRFGTDTLTSGILRFSRGSSSFTCSTRLSPFQRVHVFGTTGRIEIEIPVNAPPAESMRIWLQTSGEKKEHRFPAVDQYTLQGDAFAAAILEDQPVPVPLQDAVNNMKVIDALVKSAAENSWIRMEEHR